MKVLRIGSSRVVADGNARDLRDSALDGVDEPEVRRDPRKRCALGATARLDEEWRRGQVDDQANTARRVDAIETTNPDRRGFGLRFDVAALVGTELFKFELLVGRHRSGSVGVVRFVVE